MGKPGTQGPAGEKGNDGLTVVPQELEFRVSQNEENMQNAYDIIAPLQEKVDDHGKVIGEEREMAQVASQGIEAATIIARAVFNSFGSTNQRLD
jgi:hypothetical protein